MKKFLSKDKNEEIKSEVNTLTLTLDRKNLIRSRLDTDCFTTVLAKLVTIWFQSGALKIIDRKRHIFKLAQGEYIVPEKIEAVYSKSLYVHQIFVYGESLKVRKQNVGVRIIRECFMGFLVNIGARRYVMKLAFYPSRNT